MVLVEKKDAFVNLSITNIAKLRGILANPMRQSIQTVIRRKTLISERIIKMKFASNVLSIPNAEKIVKK